MLSIMLQDVIQCHVFFIHHCDQCDELNHILTKVMTSVMSGNIDFRFATLDSVLADHPCFSVEQVGPTGTNGRCGQGFR